MIGGGLHGLTLKGPVWFGFQLAAQADFAKYKADCISAFPPDRFNLAAGGAQRIISQAAQEASPHEHDYDCEHDDEDVYRYMREEVNNVNPMRHKNPAKWEKFKGPFRWYHHGIVLMIVAFFCFCEGYRGFQKMFSPMLVRRSLEYGDLYREVDVGLLEAAERELAAEGLAAARESNVAEGAADYNTVVLQEPAELHRYRYFNSFQSPFLDFLLAPFLVGGFYYGTTRRLLVSWLLLAFIVLCVVALKVTEYYVPSSVVPEFTDIGLVAGLGWGWISILCWTCRAYCACYRSGVREMVEDGDDHAAGGSLEDGEAGGGRCCGAGDLDIDCKHLHEKRNRYRFYDQLIAKECEWGE
eukprot:g13449.t1